jgi:hypothetical protein
VKSQTYPVNREAIINYHVHIRYTGVSQNLQNGLVQKTYSYSPLNQLVQIVFNAAGQIVQATVVKKGTPTPTPSNGASPSSSSPPTQTPSGTRASGVSAGGKMVPIPGA